MSSKRSIIFPLVPVPKPRQTRQDVWLKPPRPAVARYREFEDNIQALAAAHRFTFPDAGAHIAFAIPMPDSWSRKKKASMFGEPHQQKPDLDNLAKAVIDALRKEDCKVWRLEGLTKYWADRPAIIITLEAA